MANIGCSLSTSHAGRYRKLHILPCGILIGVRSGSGALAAFSLWGKR
jgi:hypothetical protein